MKRAKILFAAFFAATLLFGFPMFRLHAETDKTALQAAYDQVQAVLLQESDYHAASFDAFETDYALLGGDAAVQALLADPLAPQEAVDEKTQEIEAILSHLTLHQTYVRINALFWTTQAQDRSAYTLRSRAVYDAELSRLEAVLANPRSGETAILAIETDLNAALDLLESLADRAALLARDAAIRAILENDEALYTPNSFLNFETAVAELSTNLLGTTGKTAAQIVADTDASVAEALLAMTAFDAAEALLTLRADKTELLAALAAAEALDLSGFTPASRQAYLTELTAINLVASDLNASQTEVDDAVLAVATGYALLIELADKTDLTANHAEVLVAFYEQRHEYTPTSHDAFRAAVLAYGHYFAVEAMIADADALQEDVDALNLALESALSLLVRRADHTLLSHRLDQLRALPLAPYTPASITAFLNLLEEAEAVLLDPDADQPASDQALANLTGADHLLVLLADKTALEQAIQMAESVASTRHSASSIQTLELWISNANAVYGNADATQTEVDLMTARLDFIRASLKRNIEAPSIRANSETLDLNAFVFVYDATVVSYASSDPNILQIDAEGNASGLRFGRSTVTITLSNGVVETFEVLVRADVKPATIALAALIPLLPVAIVYALVFFKPSHFEFLKKIAFWTKKR
jgi:hypothetical protein